MGSKTVKQCLAVIAVGLVTLTLPVIGSASISVSQSIDRTEMAFEDSATFQVIVTWNGPAHAYRFDKPLRLQSDRLKVARLASTVRSTGSGADEQTTKTFDYTLAPILSGNATIESLIVEYVSWPDSLTGQLVTDPLSVYVYEPKPAKLAEEGGLSAGWLAVIVVLVVGGGVGVVSIVKRKAPQEKVQTPTEAFLDELKNIQETSGADLKKFQTGLYRNLAIYLGSTYQIEVEGKSAEAVVTELEKVERNQTVCQTLSGWLVRAEREKYSPLAAAPGEVMRLESEVRQFFVNMK